MELYYQQAIEGGCYSIMGVPRMNYYHKIKQIKGSKDAKLNNKSKRGREREREREQDASGGIRRPVAGTSADTRARKKATRS